MCIYDFMPFGGSAALPFYPTEANTLKRKCKMKRWVTTVADADRERGRASDRARKGGVAPSAPRALPVRQQPKNIEVL